MRTTAEKRANQNCKYVRAKRHPCNLPDPWDDNSHCTQKTWKVKRSHQYRIGTRGQRHEVLTGIDNLKWSQIWNIEQYLKEHDIPYRLEPISETFTHTYRIFKRVKDYEVPVYTFATDKRNRHQIGFRWVYKIKPTEKFQTCNRSITVAYKLVWWSDKDIGLEYILRKSGYY